MCFQHLSPEDYLFLFFRILLVFYFSLKLNSESYYWQYNKTWSIQPNMVPPVWLLEWPNKKGTVLDYIQREAAMPRSVCGCRKTQKKKKNFLVNIQDSRWHGRGDSCASYLRWGEEGKWPLHWSTFFLLTPYQFFSREDISSPEQINMPGLLRTIASRAAPVLRGHTVIQRANLYSGAAKEKIGPVVSLPLSLNHLGLMLTGWLARSH